MNVIYAVLYSGIVFAISFLWAESGFGSGNLLEPAVVCILGTTAYIKLELDTYHKATLKALADLKKPTEEK